MTRMSRPLLLQAVSALTALLIGTAVYLLDRRPETVYFMAGWMAGGSHGNPVFGALGAHLPTFVHTYAFILLTVVFTSASRAHAIAICCMWLAIDSLFEFAQTPVIAQAIVNNVPDWFGAVPFLENTSAYFLSGTFDVLDLYSIAAGALAAYLTIVISNRRTLNHASNV